MGKWRVEIDAGSEQDALSVRWWVEFKFSSSIAEEYRSAVL
jgi:hypothetical protein